VLIEGEKGECPQPEHERAQEPARLLEPGEIALRLVERHAAEAAPAAGDQWGAELEEPEPEREGAPHRPGEMGEEGGDLGEHVIVERLVEAFAARADGGDGGAQRAGAETGERHGGAIARWGVRVALRRVGRRRYDRAPMTPAAARLVALVRAEPVDTAAIADLLDHLAPGDRRQAIAALGGPGLQGRLYAALAGAPPVRLADLVAADAEPLREVIYHGKNSLPAFTHFQKRFCRPAGGVSDALWGYNHQRLAWLTGPGYFVVREEPGRGAAIDYREVPPQGCPGWPPVQTNDRGVSRLVYKDMVDYLRRVATHVFIGCATRGGREIGSYFVLSRAD
jgi:hypothetical protein